MLSVSKAALERGWKDKLVLRRLDEPDRSERFWAPDPNNQSHVLVPRLWSPRTNPWTRAAATRGSNSSSERETLLDPSGGFSMPDGFSFTLRPEQVLAVVAALKCLSRTAAAHSGQSGATLVMPCGTGKTIVALAIAHLLRAKRVAVLVDKHFLADQWRERIKQAIPAADVYDVRRDQTDPGTDGFLLCSVQTLLARPDTRIQADLVIWDEAHHCPATRFRQALGCLAFTRSLALTATPNRRDGLELAIYWLMGPPCLPAAWRERVARAQRARVKTPLVVMVTYRIPKAVLANCNRQRMRGQAAFSLGVTALSKIDQRNELIRSVLARLRKRDDGRRQVLVLTDRVAHCRVLADLAASVLEDEEEDRDKLVSVVTGCSSSTRKRRASGHAPDAMFGSFVTVSTYSYFSEAVDSDADTLVLATPRSRVEQVTGRILRGRSNLRPLVVDICDVGFLPHFTAMAKKRDAYYRGATMEVKTLDIF